MAGNTTVQAPPPRDYYSEGRDTLQAQIDLAPQLFAAEQQYRPQYAQLDQRILQDSLLGTFDAGAFFNNNPEAKRIWDQARAEGELQGWTEEQFARSYFNNDQSKVDQYRNPDSTISLFQRASPQFNELQAALNTGSRTADIRDVETLGLRATDAFRAANPQLTSIQNAMAGRAMQSSDSPLMQEARRQALEQLQAGGQLTEQEMRDAQQAARSALNARGLSRSNPGIFAEALNLDRYANARRNERLANALAVDTADLQRTQFGANLMGTTGQFLASTSLDPFMSILGRQSGAISQASGGIGQSGFSLQSQPTLFDPYSQYAGSLYASNQQNIMDARTATAANSAKRSAGMMQAGGQIAGSAIGAAGLIIF